MKFVFKKNQNNSVKLVEGDKNVFENGFIPQYIIDAINDESCSMDIDAVSRESDDKGFWTVVGMRVVLMHVVKKSDGIAFYMADESGKYSRVYVEDGDVLYNSVADAMADAAEVFNEKCATLNNLYALSDMLDALQMSVHCHINKLESELHISRCQDDFFTEA